MKKFKLKLYTVNIIYFFILATSLLFSCKTNNTSVVKLKPLNIEAIDEPSLNTYKPSRTKVVDLIHTDLKLIFDWEKREVKGKAELQLKPFFYAINEFYLDAKAFSYSDLTITHKGKSIPFDVQYNNYQFVFRLKEYINRFDTIQLYISYTAHPYNISEYCSDLDPHAHGLYFNRPDNTTPEKPYQIWTQNEPEDASLWFPTIDDPTEKMTHNLWITVGDTLQTFSNGELISSIRNTDGTRTDQWSMKLPHAPYLVAIVAGKYEAITDQWRDKKLRYIVEKEYAPHAYNIFGNTPEMIEYFSNLLGVDFPWNKYDQIFVRDYVSGAMENTTCVVFGEYIQQTPEEQLGNSHETTIAHELFHHWFGDLVTCESWANLPLNESFANYSEYLWLEHKYGKDAAEIHRYNDMQAYMSEAQFKNVNLIRYDHKGPEDMFDAHSYNKGGAVLHMLRNYVGDDAFFTSLKTYLTSHAFQTAEIHDLRLAFEKITGEDLNWFFNQWFLNKGYPTIEFSSDYDEEKKEIILQVQQKQNLSFAPIYQLPTDVAIYVNGTATRNKITIDAVSKTIRIPFERKPDLVKLDPDHELLASINHTLTADEKKYLFTNGKNILDQLELLESKPVENEIILKAINHSHNKIKSKAIESLPYSSLLKDTTVHKLLLQTIIEDKDPDLTIAAISVANDVIADELLIPVLKNLLQSPSWKVRNVVVSQLVTKDPLTALNFIFSTLKNNPPSSFVENTAYLFSGSGADTSISWVYLDYFTKLKDPFSEMTFLFSMGNYFSSASHSLKQNAIKFLGTIIENDPMSYVRMGAYSALANIYSSYANPKKEDIHKLSVYESKKEAEKLKIKFNEWLSKERNAELISDIKPL